jgi:3-mercaptopyruvate sulfurtransferase SseA
MKDQDSYRALSRAMTVRLAAVSLVTAMLMLMGCSGSQDTTGGGTGITVNTAAQIAQSSDANYNNNVNGLITGATLMSWIDDWTANRPAGITGKLVILQTGGAACTAYGGSPCADAAHTVGDASGPSSNGGIGFAGMEFVAHNNSNVFVYDVGSGDWVMSRSDGVMNTVSMVLDGPSMDAFLKKYNIDPRQDMIVFAMGQPGYFQNMLIGRGWYLFRYWGVSASHLAVLNGGIGSVLDQTGGYATFTGGVHDGGTGYFSQTASTPPDSGTVSVRDIPVDNTALQASLEEMLRVAKGDYTPAGGAFIWDARSPGEYNGNQDSTTGMTSCTITSGALTGQRCKVAFEGHIRGAADLNFSNLLYANDWYGGYVSTYSYNSFGNTNAVSGTAGDLNGDGSLTSADASYGYLEKNYLQALVTDAAGTSESPPNGVTAAAIGYKPGQVIYTHCRTTYRAMITGIAAGVVLGYPVKFYDAAWVEWGSLGNTANLSGANNVPADSPWRTDVATNALTYNPSTDVEVPPTIDYYATSANAIIVADKAYKTGTTTGGGGSGGGSPPSNPCGG